MKTFLLITSILFAGQSFAGAILCDRGDEWFQVLQSPSEVIACDWVGNELCFEGKASDALKNHFRVGEEMNVRHVGIVKIKAASVRRNKIEVIFDIKDEGKNTLSISRCKP